MSEVQRLEPSQEEEKMEENQERVREQKTVGCSFDEPLGTDLLPLRSML